ncbi:hypothetical protein M8998_07580 [Sphingobacterium sp. lm-10]|uniref:hypothetical protein n=1 Tax=Sphingobacterium sp. lm-10 TaxID=2944904 RepID=UPI002021A419|nr:hypothetical protein [Sphingobacterium sp. lm-10]MCL7987796.1 hypothetical protein [Sphingobacterium sp. lm-10]
MFVANKELKPKNWDLYKLPYFKVALQKDTITPTIKEGGRYAATSLCFIALHMEGDLDFLFPFCSSASI